MYRKIAKHLGKTHVYDESRRRVLCDPYFFNKGYSWTKRKTEYSSEKEMIAAMKNYKNSCKRCLETLKAKVGDKTDRIKPVYTEEEYKEVEEFYYGGPDSIKICGGCGIPKPRKYFSKNHKMSDLKNSLCKECVAARRAFKKRFI